MADSGNTTSPALTEDPVPGGFGVRFVPALVEVWNAEDPARVGAAALLHDPANPARVHFLLGRDRPAPDDPAHRLVHVRQVPGDNLPVGPLEGIKIAHRQFDLTVIPGGLEVENVGTPKVFIDQQLLAHRSKRRIAPGSILHVRGHSMFLFIMRPVVITVPGRGLGPPHVMGEPDDDGIAGESLEAWRHRAELAQAALARGNVLINGPTGTGKELAARALHRRLARKGLLISQNAATIQPTVAELTLFGNRAGWPNKGTLATRGWIFEAQFGSMFLDEIGELPREMQTRLLRALEGWAAHMGETVEQAIDVLFIGGTNRDLTTVLRPDVHARFVFTVHTAPLSRRLEDIPLLARAVVLHEWRKNKELAGPFVTTDAAGRPQVNFSPALIHALLGAHYPSNTRDLRNLLVRAMTEQKEGPLLPPADMSPWTAPPPPAPEPPPDAEELLAGLGGGKSEASIRRALKQAGGNVTEAARLLGITRDKLRWWMKKYGIDGPDET